MSDVIEKPVFIKGSPQAKSKAALPPVKTSKNQDPRIDEFTASDKNYYGNYSNEIIKPDIQQKKGEVTFPFAEGNIEEFLEKESPEAFKTLKKLKEKISPDLYKQYISFIQKTMNDFKGYRFKFIDTSMTNNDILYNFTTELIRERDFYKENTDVRLSNFSDFLKLQRDEGVLFSFAGHSPFNSSKKGLEAIKNTIKDLKNANVDIKYKHINVLVASYQAIRDSHKKRFPYITEDQLTKNAITLAHYLQPKITKEIIYLEKLKPGAGKFLNRLTGDLLRKKETNEIVDLDDYYKTINKYIDSLILQGENDIDLTLHNLTSHSGEATPTSYNLDKLRRIHFYGGLSKPLRLVNFNEENKQVTFDNLVDHIVKSFEDKTYKSDSKIAVVVMPGVIDESQSESDVFAIRTGKIFKDLYDKNYKILVFEADKDKQIVDALIRTQTATGKKANLLVICGHGTAGENQEEDGKGAVLGRTRKENAFKKINQKVIDEIKLRNPDLVQDMQKAKVLPPWNVKDAASTVVTCDESVLDIEDADILENIGLLMNENGQVVFNTCSAGFKAGNKESLAQECANHTQFETFAALRPIQDVILHIENDRVNNVDFKHFGQNVSSEKFTRKR